LIISTVSKTAALSVPTADKSDESTDESTDECVDVAVEDVFVEDVFVEEVFVEEVFGHMYSVWLAASKYHSPGESSSSSCRKVRYDETIVRRGVCINTAGEG
jgi:hypothetical protein